MQKPIITASLGLVHFTAAMETRHPYLFTIDGKPRSVIIHGFEAVDELPGTYDLKVTIIDLKMPNRQHFRFSPETGQGEWLGYFDLSHKAYGGHTTTWEDQEIDEGLDIALRGKLA